jgi:hypothetical protein
MRRVVIKSVVLALLGTVGVSRVAFAYIDPTTGGMLVQVLATSVAMFTGLALLFSRQIRTFIGRAKRALRHTSGEEDQQALDAATHSQDAQDLEQ